MPQPGVMEIFFGSPWPREARLGYARFLASTGYSTYLYGPKADQNLRRRWKEKWDDAYVAELKTFSQTFRAEGLRFGVCLSPMGYHEEEPARAAALLREKLALLDRIGIDVLGLFFDDMPVHEALAETQLAIMGVVEANTKAHVLFCPSFYSPDPILDKVFGARPAGYLEALAKGLGPETEIAWTGPKVISPEIPSAHLQEVAATLKRLPSLCDNFFANDGPKNCKFLKLKTLAGREPEAFRAASSWYFNPMNQPELSKVLLHSAQAVLVKGIEPSTAWRNALAALCSPTLAHFLDQHRERFLVAGLDQIPEDEKATMRAFLTPLRSEPIAAEVLAFLDGAYTVGSECLTD